MACRASRTQFGQRESVSRGHPSGGFTFCQDFCSGMSDHFGVKLPFGRTELTVSKSVHAPRAAYVRPFSTYLIGLCMPAEYRQGVQKSGIFSYRAVSGAELPPPRAEWSSAGAPRSR